MSGKWWRDPPYNLTPEEEAVQCVRYPKERYHVMVKFCPSCDEPTRTHLRHAKGISIGVPSGQGGSNGAVSRYTCVCGHVWEITFPDNAIFQG